MMSDLRMQKKIRIRNFVSLVGIQGKNIVAGDKDILLIGRQMIDQWSEKFPINRRIPASRVKNVEEFKNQIG